jgi:cytosine/adenosine deaminase-related metal-dependent hydrolase
MNPTLHEHAYAYLVQVENGRYLVSVDTGRSEVEVTSFPSAAEHYVYRDADGLVQRMRRRGFTQSVVCSVTGVPVSEADLRAALEEERVQKQAAPLPETLAELTKIPAAELKRRFKSDSNFAARANELWHGQAAER